MGTNKRQDVLATPSTTFCLAMAPGWQYDRLLACRVRPLPISRRLPSWAVHRAAALVAAARDVRQETILRAALEAGLRRGEIAGLRWPDVRLEERRLVVRQAVWQSKATGKVIRTPKSGRIGRVAIGERMAERLSDWYATSVVEGGADASGWVWPGRDGGPVSPSSISHLVGKLGKRAGLVDAKGRHVAHTHGLRHSAGSIALAEGVPLTVVSAQLRHSRPAFTAARYAHMLSDAELDRFAAAHATQTVGGTVGETSGTLGNRMI